MQAPEVMGPPVAEMIGRGTLYFPDQPGTRNSHRAARLHKPSQVVQVQVVASEVTDGVYADNGVEKVRSKRERSCIGSQRKHPILEARIPDALEVLRSAKPKVCSPNLHSKFPPQKY
jgi:hypothetical protein